MLPKKSRLSANRITEIFNSPNTNIKTDLFFVKKKQSADPLPRFAVIVPKKVASTAVLRNKNKRRVMSAINKSLKGVSGDIILTLRKSVLEVTTEEIQADLDKQVF